MKSQMAVNYRSILAASLAAVVIITLPLQAKDPADSAAVPARMTVTASVDGGRRMPEIRREDVLVKKGKERLQVAGWVAAQGDHAGLEVFILIDDASSTSLGSQLGDLRTFINGQPKTTAIGVAYMRNATVQIVQDLTADHALAAKGLRLPLGSVGAYGSAYLSAIDLMTRWPSGANRREIVLVTDGIDRAGRGGNALFNPDVDRAIEIAQRNGIVVHSIYFPGVGHRHRNFWQATNGENALAKLSDGTGGESFFLGLQGPVSFAPYLEQLQKILDNQYLLTLSVKPAKKAALERVSIGTELAGVDLDAADAVWVPALP
jgi:hypothetical protein